MSDFSTFSQITWKQRAVNTNSAVESANETIRSCRRLDAESLETSFSRLMTYRDSVGVFLSDALSFSLALLERMLVLKLGTHLDTAARMVEKVWWRWSQVCAEVICRFVVVDA
jgi:uncharacterized protein YaiE (UPF0345 family)